MKFVAAFIRFLFRVCDLFPQQNKIAFFSKHSLMPLDFQVLQDQLRNTSGFTAHIVTVGVKANNRFTAGVVLRQIWHLATCKVCVIDSYIPAVCLQDHHRAKVIQLWHAMGAIKKFGWQSVGTQEGRSVRDAKVLRMHRGYDYVIAGAKEAAPAFAEAFGVTPDKVLTIGCPRADYIANSNFEDQRSERLISALEQAGFTHAEIDALNNAYVILYAPTFRGSVADACGMGVTGVAGTCGACKANEAGTCSARETDEAACETQPVVAVIDMASSLVAAMSAARFDKPVVLFVALHPQEIHVAARLSIPCEPSNSSSNMRIVFTKGAPSVDFLPVVSVVITDYSAFAYEAQAAKVPVWFYVPDISRYTQSPGLNVNPLEVYSSRAFTDAHVLVAALQDSFTVQLPKQRNSKDCYEPSTIAHFVANLLG